MNMAKTLMGLIIVTGFLCNYAIGCMPLVKFKLRSVYRHHFNRTDYSYMKVKFQSGTPSKIAFDGLRSQRRFTEFHFENCPQLTTQGTIRIVTTIHWKLNNNGLKHYLTVRAGQIKLEQVSTVTDDHRFYLEGIAGSCFKYKIRSAAANKYIMTDSLGQATLGPDTIDRKAFFRRQPYPLRCNN